MVDYTKWDKMEFSDSDDEDEDESCGAPRVTSLNHPGKVTIGTDGTLNIAQSDIIIPSSQSRESLETQKIQSKQQPKSKSTQLNKKEAALPTVSGSKSGDTIDISNSNDILVNNMSTQQQHYNKMEQYKTKLTNNGGEHYCIVTLPPTTATAATSSSPNTSNNKSTKEMKLPIYWSQDRYTITLRMAFPSSIFPTKNIRVRVNGALQYSDRYSAVGSGIMNGESGYGSVEIVSIISHQGKDEEVILLQGKLPHPIHLNQDEDDIDFEIEDKNNNLVVVDVGGDDDSKKECNKHNKFVTIIMPKAVPMSGMVIWWDCPLIGYPKINVSAINDRNKRGGGDNETNATQQEKKKEAFQVAWEEAHKMFKEKMKTREKQEIDVND